MNKKYNSICGISQTTDGVYKNLQDYNPTKKRKVLIQKIKNYNNKK